MPSAVLTAQSPNQAGAAWGRLAARHLGSTRLLEELGEPEQPREPLLVGWGAATNGLGEEGSAGPRPNTAPCSLDRQPQKAFTLKSMGQGWARCTLSWDYP